MGNVVSVEFATINEPQRVLLHPRGSNHSAIGGSVMADGIVAKSLDEILVEIRASDKSFYVYVLRRSDGTPFYAGMGHDDRIAQHEREARTNKNSHKLQVIRAIQKQDEYVRYSIDSYHDSASLACEREIYLILDIGRRDLGTGPLTNKTTGGDYPQYGPESRQKMSEVRKQWMKNNPEKARKHQALINQIKATAEYHKRASESLRKWAEENPEAAEARKIASVKAMHSKRSRKKATDGLKRYYRRDPLARKKVSNHRRLWAVQNPERAKAAVLAMQTPEAIRKNAESRKKWGAENPILAEANKEMRRQSLRRPEVRAANSARKTKWFAENPDKAREAAQRLGAYSKSDVGRTEASQRMRARFADPESRKNMKAAIAATLERKRVIRLRCVEFLRVNGIAFALPKGRAPEKEWIECESQILRTLQERTIT